MENIQELTREYFVCPRAARVIRWLNARWEWYFVVGFAGALALLITYIQSIDGVRFALTMLSLPPGLLFLGALVATLTRMQIALRLWAWIGYLLLLTMFIKPNDRVLTLEDAWAANIADLYKEPIFAGLAYVLYFLVIPLGLFFWTRWARINPVVSKFDKTLSMILKEAKTPT